ncbi:MAG: DUF2460 domain-containing protein [Pseudomonadota bacterium]
MFLEERFDTDNSFGSDFSVSTAADITNTLVYRHTSLKHPYPTYSFNVVFNNKTLDEQLDKTVDLFNRCGGMAGGLRYKHRGDFSTNGYVDVPTSQDQLCVEIDAVAKTYQITKWYGVNTDPDCIRRKILKPVTGTVVVSRKESGVYTTLTLTTHYTISYTTGVITLVGALTGGQTLYAGCYFDIPVAFNTDLSGVSFNTKTAGGDFILSTGIDLIEIRSPA